jgi:hypothetical protein
MDFVLIPHGTEYQQYFTPHGTAHTKYESSFVGIGMNIDEAVEDLLEQVSLSSLNLDTDVLEREIQEHLAHVPGFLMEMYVGDGDEEAERYYYVELLI